MLPDMESIRPALMFVVAILFTGAALVADQDKEGARKRVPKKGDTITVKGCLTGSTLQSTETVAEDGSPLPMPTYSYQLKGKKDVLKDLRSKHDGEIVELTGELKSMLPDAGSFGTTIGGTKVVVGADPMSREQAMQGTGQPLPVLEVKSFKGSTVTCRR
jgi:hypothetical protein